MVTAILIFISTIVVSFIGSVQLGPVNLFVIDTVLFNERKHAFCVALGGSIPELIYCSLAVYINFHLLQFDLFLYLFKIVFIAILLLIGLIYFLKKGGTIKTNQIHESQASWARNIFKGFTLALLNPQLLPFWMFIQMYFNSTKALKMESSLHNLAFILGSGTGAFLLLTALIVAIHKHKLKILAYINHKYYYKTISLILFAIAIQQLCTLF